MTRQVLIVVTLLGLLTMIGCGKSPETEMRNADTAMQAAVAAEAEHYAPQAYRSALDTLNAAKAAKEEQDHKFALVRGYGKAKQLFVSAQTLADKAQAEAKVEKERVRVEVTELITKAQAEVDKATVALKGAPRGKGSRADIELIRSDLAAANAAFGEARADFEAGNYVVAKSKLEAVITKAEQIVSEIQRAKGRR